MEKGGPWPAVLMRQPYGRRLASTVTLAHPAWWAKNGFLVVIQDVRGQGESTGEFLGFNQESVDTAATHAWVRNLPQCNGLLGCYGFSYQGLTQLVAPLNTPPPDCLAPAMAGLNECRHWSCEGGAHWWHLGLGWGLQLAALQASRRGDDHTWTKIRISLERGDYLREGPELLQRHDPNGMAWRWLQQNPEEPEDWTVHTPQKSWLKAPMLLIGGWWDPHLLGVFDLWQRSREAGGKPQLLIGPATHLQWWPEVQTTLLHFFEQHLKKTSSRTEDNSQLFWNLTGKSWQNGTKLSQTLSWHLVGDQLTCHDPTHGHLNFGTGGQGEVTIVHDPWRAVPAIGGHLSPNPGPADRKHLDQRSDVATFSTIALNEDITLQGQPVLTLKAHADQSGFDLCVALSRLPASCDRVEQLSTGVLRIRGQAALHNQPRCIRLQPLLATLSSGDRLRLSISGAAWPAISVNSGHSDIPCGAPTSRHRVVAMTLHLPGSNLQLIPLTSGRLRCD